MLLRSSSSELSGLVAPVLMLTYGSRRADCGELKLLKCES